MKKYYYILIAVVVIVLGLTLYKNIPRAINSPQENNPATGSNTNTNTTPDKTNSIPNTTTSKNSGRVVVLITDPAATGLDTLQSIIMTINEISVKNPQGQWVKISKGPLAIDLLALYNSSRTGMFVDTNLTAGTYGGVKLSFGNVVVIGKNGLKSQTAKLISSTLTLNSKLVVEKGKTSAISMDLQTAKALQTATDGSIYYFPVIRLGTQHDISRVQTLGGNTQVLGGLSDFDQAWGVDENGTLRPNYTFNGLSKIEPLGSVLHIIPFDENQTEIKVSAQTAVSNAISNGYIGMALSVQTVMRQDKRVWQVVGLKAGKMVTVFLDIGTGAVIAVQ